ncbi:MAG TPA: VOC family protein [bacterium]|jgi:hypothetical protein|nr:VOC family protein [bacterium]
MARVIHFDMVADDIERAKAFYGEVFGWKFQKYEGGQQEYWLITTGVAPEPGIDGGISKRTEQNPALQNSIGVKSVAESSIDVTRNGGKVLVPKAAIPGVGWFAVCMDTEGNTFGLFEDDKTAK